MRRTEYFAELRHDARFALRQLGRNPGFTVVTALTLALGIAATTAIFSAVRAVVLRPFAYHYPDRVMIVGEKWGPHTVANVSAGNYVDWAEQTRSFDHLAAASYEDFTLQLGETPERLNGAYVTANFFSVFGARFLFGRGFTADEDQPARDQVVVLSQPLWERRFAADSAVLGRTMRINGRAHAIIGVLPAGFDPALAGEQFWVPIAFTPERRTMHDEHYLSVFGLLKPGLSYAQVQRELDAIGEVQRQRYPLENSRRGIGMMRLDEWAIGDFDRRLFVMLGAVSLVLLIACGNVANLLLARGAARGRELAIRVAIGAGRARIARQLFTESVVLALLGAAGGLALAWAMVRVLVAQAPQTIPRIADTRIDGSVLLFTLGVSIVSAVVFGLVPALRSSRQDVQSALKEGGRASHHGVSDRLRTALVIAEVALSLTLLAGAGLLIRSAVHLGQVDPGFRPEGLIAARVALPQAGYRQGADQASRTFLEILEGVRRQPGIAAVSLVSAAPLGGGGSNGLLPEGRVADMNNVIVSRFRMVVPGYLRTMGIPLVRGRDFSEQDTRSSPLVIIVSEALAQQAWPNEDPIGKRVACCEGGPNDPRWKTVIGVAGDVRSGGPAAEVRPEFYLPMRQVPAEAWDWTGYAMTVVARSHVAGEGAATAMTPLIRSAVRAVDASLPVYAVAPFAESLRNSTVTQRFNTLLLGALGAIGLGLAAAGIYSVIAYFVSLRTREIGIRMALGAGRAEVVRLISWQGLRPVLAGVGIGLVSAFWATRLIAGSLHGVPPGDPMTLALVAGLMIVIALLAMVIPARRAARVQPIEALGA